ncbi:MAG: FAD-dependent oxidoreductase [Desulfobacterales bacterium]|nr:FAD-dependent oxidoreductase [Desulfobacterales bacterium]
MKPGSRTADVTIIGGGYTGLSTAYHLKTLRPELNVCLLESDNRCPDAKHRLAVSGWH